MADLESAGGEFAGGASEAANVSIVYLFSFNGVRALFTGDVEATVGRRIVAELKAIADISWRAARNQARQALPAHERLS